MKTIYSIILGVLVVFLMLTGINQVFVQAGATGNLDLESTRLIALYDTELDNLTTTFDSNYNTTQTLANYQPDSNFIGDEIKEYFEHKSRLDQMLDTVSMVYALPDIFFLSIPFVDYEDTLIYRNVVWVLIIFTVFVAIIVGLRGKVAEDQ